jgi:hypothetical protein
MPSLGDVVNEVKAILDQVNTNTLGTRNNTSTIINQLTQIDGDIHAGFTNLAQGISVMIQLQAQNNDFLAANDKQNETIICWLHNIANLLCEIKRDSDAEVHMQKTISTTLTRLDKVLELVHARETVEVERQDGLERRMEECCPIKEPEPQPCFSVCESPQLPSYRPIQSDWKPIKFKTSPQEPK